MEWSVNRVEDRQDISLFVLCCLLTAAIFYFDLITPEDNVSVGFAYNIVVFFTFLIRRRHAHFFFAGTASALIVLGCFFPLPTWSEAPAFFANRVLAIASVWLAAYLIHIRMVNENKLERLVRQRTQELQEVQDITIRAMASLAEARDNETGNHIRRTQEYVRVLAEWLQRQRKYASVLDRQVIDLLRKSAPLHDIGKVGIPDSILLKPGKLTEAEFAVMKLHPSIGHDAIRAAEVSGEIGNTSGENSFLRFAREIAYGHHEKWDGSGYPQGLVGSDIPLSARLMAVADVYDALISRRPYKEPFSHEAAVEMILKGRGSHFDPDVVDAFLARVEDFRAVAKSFQDAPGWGRTALNPPPPDDGPASVMPSLS